MAEDDASKDLMKLIATGFYKNVHKHQVKAAQERARLVLSLAILLQVRLLVSASRATSHVHTRHAGRYAMGMGYLPLRLPSV